MCSHTYACISASSSSFLRLNKYISFKFFKHSIFIGIPPLINMQVTLKHLKLKSIDISLRQNDKVQKSRQNASKFDWNMEPKTTHQNPSNGSEEEIENVKIHRRRQRTDRRRWTTDDTLWRKRKVTTQEHHKNVWLHGDYGPSWNNRAPNFSFPTKFVQWKDTHLK